MVAATTITHVLTSGGTFEAMGVSRTAIEIFREQSDQAGESDPLRAATSENGGLAGTYRPPEMAGTIDTSSPAFRGVASPCRKRTSSSFT